MTDARPVVVADFDLSEVPEDRRPAGPGLVSAAREIGVSWVAVEVRADDDGSLATLERTNREARRAGIGLVLRMSDATLCDDLAKALGARRVDRPTALRDQLLVVVRDGRTGKRLRAEAPALPSALELPRAAVGLHGTIRRTLPNFARAGASADDLIVPLGLYADQHVANRIVPKLASRGARLWISQVEPDEIGRATRLATAGVLVRRPYVSDASRS